MFGCLVLSDVIILEQDENLDVTTLKLKRGMKSFRVRTAFI